MKDEMWELLDEVLRERGLMIVLANGEPVLRGDKTKVTPALIEMLKANRDWLRSIFCDHCGKRMRNPVEMICGNNACDFRRCETCGRPTHDIAHAVCPPCTFGWTGPGAETPHPEASGVAPGERPRDSDDADGAAADPPADKPG